MSEEKPQKRVAPSLTRDQLDKAVYETKRLLDEQEKYPVRIRKDPNDKGPNYETVQINGYTFTIMKGADVMVPKTVRDILLEAGII